MSLELLRRVSRNSAAIRALVASPHPRSISPARTEPLNMTPTYRERARVAGVPFQASPQMDFGRTPFRPVPTAPPPSVPRVRPRRETSRSRTEASLNAKVTEPLSRLYGSRASEILRQASDEFHYRTRAEASAEPYELYESGLIDSAIENLRLRRWTVGRPRID